MKNKLLIILILSIIFICLFSVSSFSFSNPIVFNHPFRDDLQVTMKLSSDVSNFSYVFVGCYNSGNSDVYVICLSNEQLFYRVSDMGIGLAGDCYQYLRSKPAFTSNVDFSNISISSFFHFNSGFTSDAFSEDSFKFVYTNFDLKREDSDDVVHNNDEKPKFREPFFLTKQEELEKR